ncbi:hypothetical protein XI09_33270 [Bradyrhizobium sp. CCBAU 11386]|uniref:TnsA endonuclease N-terminal domain-containing protein n=1 Tax=Bradyrhizobium sp. CCBAU 11386 TaxID=1630837 RepID=UPI0023022ED4|nr:TnsA endonuclease N-terminal domain-containing protein [Bradyrhizobium sp. CCBAU 11386]MDA9509424.1 hypothetical protein [Bradyrhizobium sp. CCBAU 11386]
MPALKSRGSCRGFAIHQNRTVVFESHLELMVMFLFAIRPDVAEIIDQPASVSFIDRDGKLRRHTFDFLIILAGGLKIFIAVKPEKRVAQSGIRQTISLIAEQLAPGIADQIALITDRDFTRADRFNAQQAFECARFPIPEHDDLIDRMTENMIGSAKIADLVDTSGLGGMGFRAVVRLLARRVLAPTQPSRRITPDSYVVRRTS